MLLSSVSKQAFGFTELVFILLKNEKNIVTAFKGLRQKILELGEVMLL